MNLRISYRYRCRPLRLLLCCVLLAVSLFAPPAMARSLTDAASGETVLRCARTLSGDAALSSRRSAGGSAVTELRGGEASAPFVEMAGRRRSSTHNSAARALLLFLLCTGPLYGPLSRRIRLQQPGTGRGGTLLYVHPGRHPPVAR